MISRIRVGKIAYSQSFMQKFQKSDTIPYVRTCTRVWSPPNPCKRGGVDNQLQKIPRKLNSFLFFFGKFPIYFFWKIANFFWKIANFFFGKFPIFLLPSQVKVNFQAFFALQRQFFMRTSLLYVSFSFLGTRFHLFF